MKNEIIKFGETIAARVKVAGREFAGGYREEKADAENRIYFPQAPMGSSKDFVKLSVMSAVMFDSAFMVGRAFANKRATKKASPMRSAGRVFGRIVFSNQP